MIDKLTTLELAREAGGTAYTNRHYLGETAVAFGPKQLEQFTQAVYARAMQDATDKAVDIVAMNGGSVEIEAGIRGALAGMRPCRSPYCECNPGQCTHPGCFDARGT